MVQGFPVVIASKGRGTPVVHSDKAPNATIATNGFGIPIVITHELGIPLNVDGGPGPGGTIPVNVTPPTVTSTAPLLNVEEDGKPGVWQSDTDVSYAYQWQNSADGNTWSDIAGATGEIYTPVFAYRQHFLRVGVVATNATGSAAIIYSDPTDRVAPYDFGIYPGIYGAPSGDTGFAVGRMGSLLSPEPIPGHALQVLDSRVEGYGNLQFDGDCAAVIHGLDLVLDPSPTTWGAQSEWEFGGGATRANVSPTSPFSLSFPCNVTWKLKD